MLIKAFLWLFVAAAISSLAGCVTAPPGYHYSGFSLIPNDPCEESFLNSPGVLGWTNKELDPHVTLDEKVVAIKAATGANFDTLGELGFPGYPTAFGCHATLVFTSGRTLTGIIDFDNPGSNQPIRVLWASDSHISSVKAAITRRERGDQERDAKYSVAYQHCVLEWQIGAYARSLKGSGWSRQRVADQLISEYAYGPNGEMYNYSAGMEQIVRKVVSEVFSRDSERNPAHDYASTQFLDNCQMRAMDASGR